MNFVGLRGLLSTALHSTVEQVRQMLLPDIWDLLHYWRVHPPQHLLLRMLAMAFTDWEPETEELPRYQPSSKAPLDPATQGSVFIPLSGDVSYRTFDNLPLPIQAWLAAEAGTWQTKTTS